MRSLILSALWCGFCLQIIPVQGAEPLRVGLFDIDVSPPVGSPLAYDPCTGIQDPLRGRGVVIRGAGEPVVLCALDWIGVANSAHDQFRQAVAAAAGTSPERVAIHVLHQHDAPICDFDADQLLAQQGINQQQYDTGFNREVLRRLATAVSTAAQEAKPVTHVGIGQGIVEKVASNRRVMGPDGKVAHVRWTATTDPEVRAAPVGTIDPMVKMVSFWNEQKPVVTLTYYATHPQSYYRTGKATSDFPGLARDQRDAAIGVKHVHFNGAGGNIGAGKWNDGSPANRQVLADRVADGMRLAWENTKRYPVTADDLRWRRVAVRLPMAAHLTEDRLRETLADKTASFVARTGAASDLAWLLYCRAGHETDVTCLQLGPARILHLPGELFVEYQLAAQKLNPDQFVATAAYGQYGPGYIGTEIAYSQGGYETEPRSSRVAPATEQVLMQAIKQVLAE
jgi:hypothetical protein